MTYRRKKLLLIEPSMTSVDDNLAVFINSDFDFNSVSSSFTFICSFYNLQLDIRMPFARLLIY